jgi:hypothetical protein
MTGRNFKICCNLEEVEFFFSLVIYIFNGLKSPLPSDSIKEPIGLLSDLLSCLLFTQLLINIEEELTMEKHFRRIILKDLIIKSY